MADPCRSQNPQDINQEIRMFKSYTIQTMLQKSPKQKCFLNSLTRCRYYQIRQIRLDTKERDHLDTEEEVPLKALKCQGAFKLKLTQEVLICIDSMIQLTQTLTGQTKQIKTWLCTTRETFLLYGWGGVCLSCIFGYIWYQKLIFCFNKTLFKRKWLESEKLTTCIQSRAQSDHVILSQSYVNLWLSQLTYFSYLQCYQKVCH